MKAGLVALLFAGLLAGPVSALAVVIDSSIGRFDVTTISGGTFFDFQATLVAQAWWGSPTIAQEFAGLVGDSLGFHETPFWAPELGPAFVYDFIGSNTYYSAHWFEGVASASFSSCASCDEGRIYAVATRVPESSTLGLLGLGLAGLGFASRKKLN